MENTADISFRKLAKFAKKMRLKSGDILLLTPESGLTNKQTIDRILQVCDEMGLRNVYVLVVDDIRELRITDDKEMNEHGWFHVGVLQKTIHAKVSSNNEEGSDAVEDVSP